MIGRIWRTRIRPGRAEAYETFARDVSLPMFRAQQGFAGCIMGRDGDDAWVLTLWQDRAAVEALASSETYRLTVERILASGLLEDGQTIESGEVHLLDMTGPKDPSAE